MSADGTSRVLLESEVVRDFSGDRPSGAVRKDFSGLSSAVLPAPLSDEESESEDEDEEVASSRTFVFAVVGCDGADGGKSETPGLLEEVGFTSGKLVCAAVLFVVGSTLL